MEHQTYTIEQSILSAILAENSALEIIDGKLTSDDFSDPRNGFIFKELVATISRGEYIDALVLNNMLVAKYNEKGSEITKHVSAINSEIGCSTHNIIHYAKQVREMSVVRRLLKASNDIKAFVDNRGDCTVDDLLAKADNVLQSVISGHSNTDIKLITATEAITDLLSDMEIAGTRKGLTGICTSIKKLNLKTNGLQKGNMIIVAGPASMGKTTFAMNLVRRAAETQKYPTVVFSMEMPYIDIIPSIVSERLRLSKVTIECQMVWLR